MLNFERGDGSRGRLLCFRRVLGFNFVSTLGRRRSDRLLRRVGRRQRRCVSNNKTTSRIILRCCCFV